MSDSRRVAIWDRVAAHAAARGQRVTTADVCAVAVSSARVSGAWVIAANGGGPGFVMSVTDPVSERLAELQLTVGEGPCHDVLATGAPVLTGNLDDDDPGRRWPAFTPEACQAGAGRLRVPADDRGDPGRGAGPAPRAVTSPAASSSRHR